MRPWVAVAIVVGAAACAKRPLDLGVRWVREAPEHEGATRTVLVGAGERAVAEAAGLPAGARWAVIADLDETLIDNSLYQVEVADEGFSPETWLAWERRGEAGALPGAVELAARVHGAGGHLVYLSNRTEVEPARALLERLGLWADDDRLCLRVDTSDKAPRRAAVRAGDPACGWAGEPAAVVVYLGDQMSDFPAPGEDGGPAWGARWFLVPNPMYGSWAR